MNLPSRRELESVFSLARQPIWRENLFWAELAALMRDPQFRSPRRSGIGRPILLIPGFLTGDRHLDLMKRWLGRAGHCAEPAGIRINVDCSEAAVKRLEARLERFALAAGGRVVVIGQSRGGLFARALAVRRPDLVDCIVTLGSPHSHPTRVHPFVLLQGASIASAGSLGMQGVFRHSCRNGLCCAEFRADLAAPFPPEVRFFSLYSKSDGIVDWKACLDNAARPVEIRSTHCGMAVNLATYRFLGELLYQPAARTASPARMDEMTEFHEAA
jgi:pimeloyl-ACP methyl ester carboxylesterase